jgi:hypothetical protein
MDQRKSYSLAKKPTGQVDGDIALLLGKFCPS